VAHNTRVFRVHLQQAFTLPSSMVQHQQLHANAKHVGGGGLHFGLVRRAFFLFAPRSTPSKLLLTAVTLFSQGRVAA
jgi:hypothetical protein